jgi:hypothetical protein
MRKLIHKLLLSNLFSMNHTNFLKKSGVLVLSAVLLSSCSLFGGGVAPEQNVRSMQSKLWGREIKSGNTTGTIAVDMTSPNATTGKAEEVKFSVAANGDFDIATKGDEKLQANLKFDMNTTAPDGTAVSGNVETDLAYLTKRLYINLKTLNLNLPEFEQYKSFIEPFKNNWYFIDTSKANNPVTAEVSVENKLTPEQEAKIKEILSKTDLFNVTKDLGNTTLNGIEMYHYAVALNKNSIVPFIKEVSTIIDQPFTTTNEKDVTDGLDKINVTGEIWIGVKDNDLYRMNGTIAINDPTAKSTGTIAVDLTLDPNKTVSITAPAGAKDLMEEVGKIFGAPSTDLNTNGNTQIPDKNGNPDIPSNSNIPLDLNMNVDIPQGQ